MIYELPKNDYEKARPIFHQQSDHAVINAIIDGNNPGRIFVDDLAEPKTALVWAQMEMFYLGGDDANESFNNALAAYLTERIAPEAREIGDEYFQLEVYPAEKWQRDDKIKNLLAVHRPRHGYRWRFVFHPERYQQLTDWREEVPTSYTIERIDHTLLRRDHDGIIRNEITTFWRTVDEFMLKGVGFCAMQGDRVVSVCLSVFVSGKEFEIGINTYSKQDRGRGLATLTARAFINYCIEHDLTPHWGTEDFRLDSIAIAEKVGFERIEKYRLNYFPFAGWNDDSEVGG